MKADDPRHGTTRGHNAGCRCTPCSDAKLAYDKRRRWDEANGIVRRVPTWRLTRRVQALQALGWSLRAIAAEAGFEHPNYCVPRREYVYLSTFDAIDAAYERMAMRHPEATTRHESSRLAVTRNHAKRNGYAPPLAWLNIDDPDEQPADTYRPERTRTDVDEVVVLRLLDGKRVDSTPAEKAEAIARWTAAGKSERELTMRHGWKPGRYKKDVA